MICRSSDDFSEGASGPYPLHNSSGSDVQFSVVIPTHVRPELLKIALESVLSQRSGLKEVLVVDDADCARTKALVSSHEQRDDRVKYVLNAANPGVCNSRNLGATNASSDWIAFLDDDDYWDASYLPRAAVAVATGQHDFCLTSIREVRDQETVKLRLACPGLSPERFFDQGGFMTGSNVVIRKSTFLAVGGFDPLVTVFNDWDLFYRLLAADLSYCVVSDPLVFWRHHVGDRISTASLRRANGMDFFADRYARVMPSERRTDLLASAMSIRRSAATKTTDKLRVMVDYAMKAGVFRAFRHSLKRAIARVA